MQDGEENKSHEVPLKKGNEKKYVCCGNCLQVCYQMEGISICSLHIIRDRLLGDRFRVKYTKEF